MKKLLIVLVLVVALAVGGGVILLSSVNSLLVRAVNTYGPELLQTNVHLDNADISFLDGKGTLQGLFIGNPAGFSGEYAFKVDTIQAALDASTLTEDVVVIERIEVVAPDILYERTLKTDNLQTLVNNLKKATNSGNDADRQAASETKASRVLIRELLIRSGKVSLVLPGIEKPVGINLPDIRLRDIGKESGSVSFAEAAVTIVQAISDAVLRSSVDVTVGAESLLRDTGKNVGDKLDTVGGKLDNVTDKLSNIFGK